MFREITRQSVGKRLAILLIEKGSGEVITAPVIRAEIPGGRVQISGSMTTTEAADVALFTGRFIGSAYGDNRREINWSKSRS